MSDIPADTKEAKENKAEPLKEVLSPAVKRSIQGLETVTQPAETAISHPEENHLTSTDPTVQAELDEWKNDHDQANWEYQIGSPHADYQLSMDLKKAEQQLALGEQANTANCLNDAIDTTLRANQVASFPDETKMDRYFREKYGSQPYIADAYLEDEDT